MTRVRKFCNSAQGSFFIAFNSRLLKRPSKFGCFRCIPFGQPLNIGFPINGRPLRELIQNPGNSKPDLTNDGNEPQAKSAINRMCYSVVKEESQNDQPHNDHSSVWRDLALWDWYYSRKWLRSISWPAQKISKFQ